MFEAAVIIKYLSKYDSLHSLDIGLYLYRVLKNQRLISSYMYMYMHVHVHVYVHTYTNMQLLYINVHTYSKWYVHVC